MNLHLMVGEVFNYEFERELQREMTQKFTMVTSKSVTDILPMMKDSSKPVAVMPMNFEGLGLILMERKAASVELSRGEFQNYLTEDHVNGISFDSTQWKKPVVKEKYSRYIKTLVLSGEPAHEDFFMQPQGMKLELVLFKNPYALERDEELPIQLLMDGKPLENTSVGVTMQNERSAPVTNYFQTNKEGLISFLPALNTVCVAHCVFIRQLPDGSEEDFESVWSSYSFKVLNDNE